MWTPTEPYNELSTPPIAQLESREVLKATTEARAELAALDQAVHRLPNPSILLNAVTLLEAQASSEIENIVTTTDELFQLASVEGTHANPATRETLRYRTALYTGIEALNSRPLSTIITRLVCSSVNGQDMRIRDLPGTFIGDPITHTVRYTPPEGPEVIADKLDAWERFVHGEHALDPLVVMAAAHYHFEAIHPFPDGNGRTGRILNILMLIESGLLREPVLYLSRYIIENKNMYYRLLLEVTKKSAWEEWILFMLEGVRQTAALTLALIDEIQALQENFRAEMRAKTAVGPNSDVLDLLFERPYCRIVDVIERGGVSRPTASKWLNDLVSQSMLDTVKVGRDRLFINSRLLKVLSRPA
ncbi:MAG: Fic family protein [Brevibacterium sp.]|uniref:Fic family protein n=1 Tax=Brevibacterium TaxID=1696 RepID=UPI003F887111